MIQNLRGHDGWRLGDDGSLYRSDGIRVSLSTDLLSNNTEEGLYDVVWLVQVTDWHGLGSKNVPPTTAYSFRCTHLPAKLSIPDVMQVIDRERPLSKWRC